MESVEITTDLNYGEPQQGSAPYIEVLLILRMEPQESAGYFLVPVNLGHLISIQKSHRRAIGKAGLDTFPFYCWVSKLLKRVFPPGIPNSQPRSPRIQTLSARYLTYTSSGRRISHSGPDSPHRTGCATGPYSFSAPQKLKN